MQQPEIDSAVFCDGAHYTIISRENSSILTCSVTSGAGGYTLAGCCRSALVRGLSSPELYRTALTAAGAAISGARRIAANSPDSIASTDGILTATIGIGGTDTAEIGAICADVLEDGNLLIEGAAWPIARGEAAGRGPEL